MAELLIIFLGSLFRMVLILLFGALIERGYMTEGQFAQLGMGLGGFVVVAGWALWKRYHDRLKFLTALESPAGTSEAHVVEKVKAGTGATLGG